MSMQSLHRFPELSSAASATRPDEEANWRRSQSPCADDLLAGDHPGAGPAMRLAQVNEQLGHSDYEHGQRQRKEEPNHDNPHPVTGAGTIGRDSGIDYLDQRSLPRLIHSGRLALAGEQLIHGFAVFCLAERAFVVETGLGELALS